MRVRDKRAIVTGAAGDIGKAIMAAFLREGAQVVGIDLDGQGLAAAVAEASAVAPERMGPPVVCDITVAAEVEKAVASAAAAMGGLDLLVNNAATVTPQASVVDIPLEAWDRALAVNLTGAMLLSRYAIPFMRAAGGGVIINVASQLGQSARPGRAAYGATKAALIHLSRIMALDHAAEGIRVNSLSPGAILTSRVERRYGSREAAEKALAPLHPLGRLGTAAEIASAALYLASDESAFMTGADLRLDGGFAA